MIMPFLLATCLVVLTLVAMLSEEVPFSAQSRTYLVHALAGAALGLLLRTAGFILIIRRCFHSYDRVTDKYRDVLRFGHRVIDYDAVMPLALRCSYLVPALFLIVGIVVASRSPLGLLCNRRGSLCAIAVGLGAEILLWLFLWHVGMASHFTSGDAFDPGV